MRVALVAGVTLVLHLVIALSSWNTGDEAAPAAATSHRTSAPIATEAATRPATEADELISVPPSPPEGPPKAGHVAVRPRPRFRLGIRGPDAPYGRGDRCAVTTDRWPLAGPDGSQVQLKKSPKFDADCMQRIEPLNPNVPLKGVDKCAQNNRRWEDRTEFKAHMDYDETTRRVARTKLLGKVCPERMRNRKKVFVDAGCRHYDSSTQWFRTNYPEGSAFDVLAMDVVARYGVEYMMDRKAAFFHGAVWNESGFVSFVDKRGLEGDGYFHTRWIDMPRAPRLSKKITTVPTIPFADFLKRWTSPEDFVVVKMDIEGAEWLVLESLASNGALSRIDELFLECHHGEWVPMWPTQHSLADCHRLLNTLRDFGVFAHEWY